VTSTATTGPRRGMVRTGNLAFTPPPECLYHRLPLINDWGTRAYA
jgi:hypothetical protein